VKWSDCRTVAFCSVVLLAAACSDGPATSSDAGSDGDAEAGAGVGAAPLEQRDPYGGLFADGVGDDLRDLQLAIDLYVDEVVLCMAEQGFDYIASPSNVESQDPFEGQTPGESMFNRTFFASAELRQLPEPERPQSPNDEVLVTLTVEEQDLWEAAEITCFVSISNGNPNPLFSSGSGGWYTTASEMASDLTGADRRVVDSLANADTCFSSATGAVTVTEAANSQLESIETLMARYRDGEVSADVALGELEPLEAAEARAAAAFDDCYGPHMALEGQVFDEHFAAIASSQQDQATVWVDQVETAVRQYGAYLADLAP